MLEHSSRSGVRIEWKSFDGDGRSRAIVRVEGEVDLGSAPRLGETLAAIAEGDADEIVVDFEDTTFIDSSGVRALLEARTAMQDGGGSLVVEGVSPQVARVFDLLGITKLLCPNERHRRTSS